VGIPALVGAIGGIAAGRRHKAEKAIKTELDSEEKEKDKGEKKEAFLKLAGPVVAGGLLAVGAGTYFGMWNSLPMRCAATSGCGASERPAASRWASSLIEGGVLRLPPTTCRLHP
jgi:hypothetical protein